MVAVEVEPVMVELDDTELKHESLLLPVTVMSGLVLASLFPVESSLEIGGWTR